MKAPMTVIHLRAPVALKPATEGALPTRVEGIAYSGGIVPTLGCVIDLSTTSIADRLPLLHEHGREAIVGAITRATITGGTLLVEGKLFSDIPGGQAEKIAQLAQRGAPFQMSVGLFGYVEATVRLGEVVTVNGATVAGPVTVLRGGTVRGVSLVTLGADPNAVARLFGQDAKGTSSLDPRSVLARRTREAAGYNH